MATWGKTEINIDKYNPDSTMYYEYNTTSDQYYIKTVWNEDFGLGNERFESENRLGPEIGEAMMEAFIAHLLYFLYSGDTNKFIERYIHNNRFIKKKLEKLNE